MTASDLDGRGTRYRLKRRKTRPVRCQIRSHAHSATGKPARHVAAAARGAQNSPMCRTARKWPSVWNWNAQPLKQVPPNNSCFVRYIFRGAPGSNICTFHVFRQMPGRYKSGHDRFLTHSFQLILLEASAHSTQYSPSCHRQVPPLN